MIRRVILITVLAATLFAIPLATAADPDERTVVRITYLNQGDLERLASTFDIWEVRRAEHVVVAAVSSLELAELAALGYQVEVDEARTLKMRTPRAPEPDQVAGIPGYPCYRTVEETYAALQTLAAAHPDLVTLIDIGDSWEKTIPGGAAGYDLWAAILTNHAIPGPKPVFFLMAEIHAREYVTAETALRFAEGLVNGYGTDADATWLLDSFEVHVVPMTNPDGRKKAEAGLEWRKNTDSDDGCASPSSWGTDLNRNSAFKWGGAGSSSSPCDETYHGPSMASEPEVQAIQAYIQAVLPDQRGPGDTDPAPVTAMGVVITLHSYSELVLWPWGWTNSAAPNDAALATFGRKLAYFNHYTPEQSVGLYPTTGSTDDWAYGMLGVASYTFEMGNEFFEDCSPFQSTILPDNLAALRYAFKACRRPYQTPAGPEVIGVTCNPPGVAPGGTVTVAATADDTRRIGEGSQAVNLAQWTLDAPSWQSGTATHPMSASDGSFSSPIEAVEATIDTTGWSLGRHVILVEARDAGNSWGVPSAAILCVATSSHGVGLTPPEVAGSTGRGQTFNALLKVHNPGNEADSFIVSVAGNTWPTVVPALVGPVEPCGDATFSVQVTVPVGSAACAVDVVTVTVASAADPSSTASTVVTTASQALPSAAIAAPVSACPLATGLTASVPDAGTGFTYAWTIGSGSITAGQDTPAITFSTDAAGPVALGVTVSSGPGCSNVGTATVTLLPGPSAAITAPANACTGSTGLVASVPTAGPNAVYRWTIVGGTITGGLGTRAVTFTAGSGSSVVLSIRVSNASGCSASGSTAVPVSSPPSAVITALDTLCAGSGGHVASVPPAGDGASYQWTISGGAITGGQDTPLVTYSAGSTGTLTLGVTVLTGAGCAASASLQQTVNASPHATITAPANLCPNGTGYVASVPDAGDGASYQWTIDGGAISSSPTLRSIVFSAPASGTTRLDVVVTNAVPCAMAGSVSIPVQPTPSTVITSAASVCPGTSTNQASVTDAGAGAVYTWSVGNGLLLSGNGTRTITYQAGVSGDVTLGVLIVTGPACTFAGEEVVPIETPPAPTVTGARALCAGGSLSLSVSGGPFATYLWRKDGEALCATGATYSKDAVSAADAGSYTVEVTSAAGCSGTSPAVAVTVAALPVPGIDGVTSTCAGGSLSLSVSGGPFATYLWRKDGEALGATGATYSKDAVSAADAGSYTVEVTSAAGCSGTSPAVAVTVAAAPALQVGDVTIIEGNSGLTNAEFTLTMSAASCVDVTVETSTIAGTATAGGDFATVTGLQTLLAGQTSRTVTVPIIGDWIDEADETFTLHLSNPANASITDADGLATIVDDDTAGIAVSAAPGLVTTEAGGSATFTVVLTSQPTAGVMVPVASTRPSEGVVSPAFLTFTDADWATPQTVTVSGVDDAVYDGDQGYAVTVGPAVGADPSYSGASGASVAFTNLDDDPAVLKGDANGDGVINVQDVFHIINFLFANGPAPLSGDENGNGSIDISDVFYLINHLFAGGPGPV